MPLDNYKYFPLPLLKIYAFVLV